MQKGQTDRLWAEGRRRAAEFVGGPLDGRRGPCRIAKDGTVLGVRARSREEAWAVLEEGTYDLRVRFDVDPHLDPDDPDGLKPFVAEDGSFRYDWNPRKDRHGRIVRRLIIS